MKRIKLITKKSNPLFELWLEEWKEEAVARNSDLQYSFAKALQSLKKYPLPLRSGRDCIILQHFGTKICSMLDKKLEKLRAQNRGLSDDLICTHCGSDDGHTSKRKNKSPQVEKDINRTDQRVNAFKQTISDDLNLSSWRTEKYVVLLILYKKTLDPCYSGFTTEVELFLKVKEFSFRVGKGTISRLFDNGLISIVNAPRRYGLTEYGVNVAKKICKIANTDLKLTSPDDFKKIHMCVRLYVSNLAAIESSENLSRNTDAEKSKECPENILQGSSKPSQLQRSDSVEIIFDEKFEQTEDCVVKEKDREVNIHTKQLQETTKTKRNINQCTQSKAGSSKTDAANSLQRDIYLEPHNFDIILLVDTQETRGGKTKPQHDATLVELSELGLLFEVRHLKVGDFAWVARCRVTNSELVLPYIVERKRIDDLSASIIDKRYYEQKFRLKQSGITNLMYIVEEYDKHKKLTIPYSSLMQASINTLIQDGFLVKYTKNHKDSMIYLSSVTKILQGMFKNKILIGCKKEALGRTDISSDILNLMEFQEFNKAASKQKVFKVSEMFIRHLLQLKGISVDKASAITEQYPTPRLLLDALQSCDGKGELLLSGIVSGNTRRQLGPVLSKTVYQLYTKKNLN